MSGELIRPRKRSKLVVTSSENYPFVLFMASGGMIFTKILNFDFFLFFSIELFHVITGAQILKGSRNIQGLALIRAVLFNTNLVCNRTGNQTLTAYHLCAKRHSFFRRISAYILFFLGHVIATKRPCRTEFVIRHST